LNDAVELENVSAPKSICRSGVALGFIAALKPGKYAQVLRRV
jgi:hypothetical protein